MFVIVDRGAGLAGLPEPLELLDVTGVGTGQARAGGRLATAGHESLSDTRRRLEQSTPECRGFPPHSELATLPRLLNSDWPRVALSISPRSAMSLSYLTSPFTLPLH